MENQYQRFLIENLINGPTDGCALSIDFMLSKEFRATEKDFEKSIKDLLDKNIITCKIQNNPSQYEKFPYDSESRIYSILGKKTN